MISAEEVAKTHLSDHWMSWMKEWLGHLEFKVQAGVPSNFHGFGDFSRRDVWYIDCPDPFWSAGMICDSTVMILDRFTGKVCYFGSANDEG